MKRRTAIGRILLTGVVGAGAVSGYKWYQWTKTPDFDYLDKHRTTLAAIVQVILPPGPSIPGAADAGVHDAIIRSMKFCANSHVANTFIEGLKDLARHCRSNYDKDFEACTPDQQYAALQHFEQKDRPFKGVLGKAQKKFLGQPFFPLLRDYTGRFYSLSELGGAKGFAYTAVPGAWHACIPKEPGQRAWATN